MFAIEPSTVIIPGDPTLRKIYYIDFDDEHKYTYSSIYHVLGVDEDEIDNVIVNQFKGQAMSHTGELLFKKLEDAEQALEWLEAHYMASKLSGYIPEEDYEDEDWDDYYDEEETRK